MKSIVLYTAGTLGDHLPFVALGKALGGRGHRVRMALNSAMLSYARRAGLEAAALTDIERGPEEAREGAWAWDHWNYPEPRKHPKAGPFDLETHVEQVRQIAALCRDAGLLISTAIRHQGFLAACSAGIPWLTVSLNPFSFSRTRAESFRASRSEAHRSEVALITEINRLTLDALGVIRAIPQWSPGWLLARHVLLASSPRFSRPDLQQLQPRSSLDLTGFWFYQDPEWEKWEPDDDLRAFCEQRPLVLAFSSQPLEDPGRILNLNVRAARMVGLPLLVQSGWAGFSPDILTEPEGDDIMFAPFLPQDWLFARAAASIQHGGIGSIARALRQGCPLLIEPFGNDQIYNAQRVQELGVGGTIHPFKTSSEEIARALERWILGDECRRKAGEMADSLREEDGLAEACRLIEIYLERVEKGEPGPPGGVTALGEPVAAPAPVPLSLLPSPHNDGARERRPMEIPRLIHQTWKNRDLPPELAVWQETWKRHHPGWEYRLWTDDDNLTFIERHYPWFLPIYRGYPEEIMRVDAVRYFLMYHYGGVYADLDYECLRPLGPLLKGKRVVMGLEPEEHALGHHPRGLPFEHLICNALIASVPGHPFWEHVIRQLVASHDLPGPLDATGPFLLSRARESFDDNEEISLETTDLLNPIDNRTPWRERPADERERMAATAYTVHHWVGTWWRPQAARRELKAKVSLLIQGAAVSVSELDVSATRKALARIAHPQKISCLMVTAGRPELARRAVESFRRQSWPNRELVIIDDGDDEGLQKWVADLEDEAISCHRLPSEGKTLGELRNIAVNRSAGDWLAQWDDDDISDPLRLEIQMMAATIFGADGCFLERHTLWWPERRRIAFSGRRIWEGSFLCSRNVFPRYPHLKKGEDTPVKERIIAENRVALLDLPHLYTYVFHGANTFDSEHWEKHWEESTELFSASTYDIMVRQIEGDLPNVEINRF